MIDITGLNKADVLAALYNASRPQGMGFMHYDPTVMTRAEAELLLQQYPYFDYLKGRVMKVSLKSDTEFDERFYDRDNGDGAAQSVITALREGNQAAIAEQHRENVRESATLTMNRLNEETRIKSVKIGGVQGTEITLGLADAKEQLLPKIREARKSVD